MSTPKGYPSGSKLDRLIQQFATVEPVRLDQFALSVLGHMFMRAVGTDAAETGSAVDSIVATSHSAQKGDVIRFTSGNLSGVEVKVASKTTNAIVPAENLSEAPANGDTFQILRHKYPLVDASGNLLTSGTVAGLLEFTRDGADQVITEDTVTPSNNRPLPVKLLDTSGNVNQVAATQSGTWNITNISGTVSLPTGAATAARQDTGNTSLSSMDTKLSTLITQTDGVEASLSSIDGKLPAALGQLAMAASLSVAIASNQSAIPVSQSGTWNITDISGTISLPTGASTAARQDTGNTSLSSIDTKMSTLITQTDGVETSLSSIDGKLPSTLGQKVMASSLAVVLASDQASVPVAATLQTGTATIGSVKPAGLTIADSVQKASGTVTSGAWVELIASTAAACQGFTLFDSSGYSWELGVGGAGAEVRKIIVPPGGFAGFIPLAIAASSRISARAMSTTCDYSAAEMDLTLLG